MAKLLLVEDNDMNRDMLTRRLQRRGYEVITAMDGAQGLALAQSESPALILMDISLPVLDGLEAIRRLKTTMETKSIPVVPSIRRKFHPTENISSGRVRVD